MFFSLHSFLLLGMMNSNTDISLYATVDLSKERKTRTKQNDCTATTLKIHDCLVASGNGTSSEQPKEQVMVHRQTTNNNEKFESLYKHQSAIKPSSPLYSEVDPSKKLKMRIKANEVATGGKFDSSSFHEEGAYDFPMPLLHISEQEQRNSARNSQQKTEKQARTLIPQYSVVDLSKKRKRRVTESDHEAIPLENAPLSPLEASNHDRDQPPLEMHNMRSSQDNDSGSSSSVHITHSVVCETINDNIGTHSFCQDSNGSKSSTADVNFVEETCGPEGGQIDSAKQKSAFFVCFDTDKALLALIIVLSLMTFLMCLGMILIVYQVANVRSAHSVASNVSDSCTVESSLQKVTETKTGTVNKSCFNVSECLNAAGSINLFYSHLHDSQVSKARLERYTNGIAFSVNSCSSFKHLSVKSPSGYYWLSAQNGSPVNVYCDMDLSWWVDKTSQMGQDRAWCEIPM